MRESIIQILMRRDGMTLEEAQDHYDEGRSLILEAICEGTEDPEEIMLDFFGLEPDYLDEIIF